MQNWFQGLEDVQKLFNVQLSYIQVLGTTPNTSYSINSV